MRRCRGRAVGRKCGCPPARTSTGVATRTFPKAHKQVRGLQCGCRHCGPARVLQLGLFPKAHWQVWQVSSHSHIAPATVCADSVRWGTISNIMHVVWCVISKWEWLHALVWFDGCRCIAGQSVRAGQCRSLGQCYDASVGDQSRYLSCIEANMSENSQHPIAPKNQGDSVDPAC